MLCEGLGEVGGSQCRHCSLLHTGPTCTSGGPACERREERKREGGESKGFLTSLRSQQISVVLV